VVRDRRNVQDPGEAEELPGESAITRS
jgi:hypothetical protein